MGSSPVVSTNKTKAVFVYRKSQKPLFAAVFVLFSNLSRGVTMKKTFILVAAAVLAISCTACGAGSVTASGVESTASSAAVSSSASSSSGTVADAAKYSDSLKGLITYMGACGYIDGNGLQMEYQLIGAKNGYRYTKKIDKKQTVTAEFYEYDLKNLNETAKKILDSVQQNGYFTLFNKKITAYHSDNGKYLMVYKDSASGDASTARQKEAAAKFKAFKK